MAAELKDFRGKITAETDAALEAESRIYGRDKQDVVREILHAWALRRIAEASVLTGLVRAQGLVGESEGVAGESQGTSGSRRESRGVTGGRR